MPAEHTYDYAIVRVVPRVERGEQINVGVILSCVDGDFLEARIETRRRAAAGARSVDRSRGDPRRAWRPFPRCAAGGPGGRTDRRRCRRATASAGWCRRAARSSRRPRSTRGRTTDLARGARAPDADDDGEIWDRSEARHEPMAVHARPPSSQRCRRGEQRRLATTATFDPHRQGQSSSIVLHDLAEA